MRNTTQSIISRAVFFSSFFLCLAFLDFQSASANSYEDQVEESIQKFLQDAFHNFLYHGAYLDQENHYLVISLKIHPGLLSKMMQQDPHSIDEILAYNMIKSLYTQRFSSYLLAFPKIQGISVIISWQGCQRITEHTGPEKVLLKDGISEFDRFDVNRSLYFKKFGIVQMASNMFSAGKLFDQMDFTHMDGVSYKGIPFHRFPDSP